MVVILFFLGLCVGIIVGVVACVRYVRQEVLDSVGPGLRQLQSQVDIIQSSLLSFITIEHSELGTLARRREI